MNEKLIKRIKQFNKIKYPNDNETRIIIARLKPQGYISEVKVKFTSNNPKYTKITDAAVTTAPKYKE
jgi:DNA polymerase III epsilon subunit-like protein